MVLKSTLIAFSFVCCVSAYKILVVNPIPIPSLNSLGIGYVRHLTNAGHEVTFMSPFSAVEDIPQKNYRHIDMSDTHFDIFEGDDLANTGFLMQHPLNEDGPIDYLQFGGVETALKTFENNGVQALLNDPNVTFDAVITDFVETEIYAAFAAYYDCPMIWAYSLGTHWQTLQLIDETTNPAYAFDYLTSDIPPHHTIGARVKKLWTQIKWHINKWFKTYPKEKELYEKTFTPLFLKKNKTLPDYSRLLYNASFVLSNDFVGNGLITSVPQNFKFIGGYHMTTPTKPLPNHIKSIMDKAEHGVIYFSMGSNWKSTDIPEHITKGLLELFGSLRQTVIWKYEDDSLKTPKNVHILQWAPQQSILAHPKLLFFISHGGLLSTIESISFGVPTIGIPIFFDQFINVNRGVQDGWAVKVSLTLNMVEDLRTAIQKMVSDPTYKQRAMQLSQIFHDRVVPPAKELVHWVEHVVRTRGAPHLRSPASLMPWYQKMFLDVALIFVTALLLVRFLIKKYLNTKNNISGKNKKD